MYQVKRYEDRFEIYELSEEATESWFRISPERGGIVTSFGVQGTELLYLDKDTFYDSSANVRGGIPILFPICGQLENGEYELSGQTYKLKQHGFARTNSWSVVRTDTEGKASVTLNLRSDDETRSVYPFDFELVFEFALKNGALTILQNYRNLSDQPMPMYAGFHPYFISSEKNLAYDTDATRYIDYNDMREKNYEGTLDLSNMVESATFLDAKRKSVSFPLQGVGRAVTLEYGPEFKYIVVWSVKGKNFVCVEPWMARNKQFNTWDEVVYVPPGEALHTFMTIKSEALDCTK